MNSETNLVITAKFTRIKKRPLDKYTYLCVAEKGCWEWDVSEFAEVKYPKKYHQITEPELCLDMTGISVHDIENIQLKINGQINKNFYSKLMYRTPFEICSQNNYFDDFAMIEVSEQVLNQCLKISEEYDELKLEGLISRSLLATGLECNWINLIYDKEFFSLTSPIENPPIRTYVVNPKGVRIQLERLNN